MYKGMDDYLLRIKILSMTDGRANMITPEELPYDIEIVADRLFVPWAIAIGDEGKLIFTERSGAIRVIEEGRLKVDPLITFERPFAVAGEGGLMGIALDPDFKQNHYIYVMHTYEEGSQIYSRVIRLLEQDNTAVIDRVLIDRIPAGRIHDGGRLKIGPDRKLYITTGDAGRAALSQDRSSLAGKILRINLDGSIPEDNPFDNSPVYSYGHRNPQGLAWNLSNNILYASEHGQTAHDEINIIHPGANYGWPLTQGDETAEGIEVQRPMIHSDNNTWAPSGIAYIENGPWRGKLLVATLRGSQLLVITLNENGTEVVQVASALWNEFGRLREVIEADDGTIYLTTSNRDGRGTPDRTDDRIIKLIPKRNL